MAEGTLIVEDAGPFREPRPGVGGGPRLLLDTGVLETGTGALVRLWTAEDKQAMDRAAQRVSERAWQALEGHSRPHDPRTMAALIAVASKLDVYQEFCAHFRVRLLLERALVAAEPERIEWRAATPPPRERSGTTSPGPLLVRTGGIRTRVPSLDKAQVTAWLKRTKWEWSARAVASVLERLKSRAPAPHAAEVVGVFDVRNAGMIANVALVLRELRQRGHRTMGVSMHPAATALAERYEAAEQVVPVAAFARGRGLGRWLRHLPAVMAELRSSGSVESEPAVRAAAAHAFEGLHRGYVLQTALDWAAVDHLLERLAPRAVVLASDAHRYARLLVVAARARSIPTFVVQHGALVKDDFYVPVVADKMLAWGPWCRDRFVELGTPPAKVIPTGFVRAPAQTERVARATRPTELLFAAQPLAPSVNQDLLTTVRTALEADESLRLTIRPHPGEGRRAELERVVAGWPDAVARRTAFSSPGRSLTDDLAAAHAVVIAQSTVGIDALAAGAPVLLLRHAKVREAIPYLEFRCAIAVEEPGDLLAGLDSLADPGFQAELAAGASAFLAGYVGKVGTEALASAAAEIEQALAAGEEQA